MKSLEESLGTQLFDRLPDGMALTNHGEELVPGEGAVLYLLVHKDMRKSPAVRLMMDAVTELFSEYNDVLHGEQTHSH